MARFHLVLLAAALLILVVTLSASPSGAQKKGFQSINCGGGNFVDPQTTLEWKEDPFNNESYKLYGRASKVSSGVDNITNAMTSLRYFPQESVNRKFCYSFEASVGNKYLVRASFFYGNYDKLNQPPTFSLIINYDTWTSVSTSLSSSPTIKELIFVSEDNNLNICLAPNLTTNHTPFISTLELRPLDINMYSMFGKSSGLKKGHGLQLWKRINYGAKTQDITRYPDDPYDRIWDANTSRPTVSMNASNIGSPYYEDDESQPPAQVLATAITTSDRKGNLSFTYQGLDPVGGFRMEMHFLEVDERFWQTARRFGLAFPKYSGVLSADPIMPARSPISSVLEELIQLPDPLQITLFPYADSPAGPLLNAFELFQWTHHPLSTSGTFPDDVLAIVLIQKHFNLMGHGQGDPCMPRGYEWTWIACTDDLQPKIKEINLARFNLTQDIPPSINNLTSLQKIDLSHNMLNGSIPDIGHLHNLNYLDVSYNNLCGSSPNFNRPITYNYEGNTWMCDESKCQCDSSKYASSSTTMSVPTTNNHTKKYIIAISIMGALYVLMLIMFLIICKARSIGKFDRKATSKMNENKKGVDDLKGLSYIKMFTYNEIRNATLDFTTILGKGGFGKVYHGLLPTTNEAIAVKSLDDASKQGLKEFYNEVAILSRVRHKNLVCLLGCCVESTYMLIYEYIAKGNLKDLLYGDVESTDKPLRWTTRLQVALDASQGLDYLHTGCDPPIVHRDVKTSNILLSDKMQAKLADFGLSRLKEVENKGSHISTLNVVGTPGYLDPAYNATFQLTDKSDVYSFGIVLFELICGRAPIDMFTSPPHIVDWVTPSIEQGKVGDIVDPMLANGYKMESMWKVVDIAFGCVEKDRMKRPKMSHISQALRSALEIEMSESLLSSSKDTSGSSSTSDGKWQPLQYF